MMYPSTLIANPHFVLSWLWLPTHTLFFLGKVSHGLSTSSGMLQTLAGLSGGSVTVPKGYCVSLNLQAIKLNCAMY